MPNKTDSIVREILALYRKHGWAVRRVLLTKKSREEFADSVGELFGAAEISEFEKDAVWFSRPSRGDGEAWELRLLAETPYALIEVFGEDQDEEEREDIRADMEERILQAAPEKIEMHE